MSDPVNDMTPAEIAAASYNAGLITVLALMFPAASWEAAAAHPDVAPTLRRALQAVAVFHRQLAGADELRPLTHPEARP